MNYYQKQKKLLMKKLKLLKQIHQIANRFYPKIKLLMRLLKIQTNKTINNNFNNNNNKQLLKINKIF